MNWYGPRGNCGCCGGNCTCDLPCQCNDGRYFATGVTTLSNWPAVWVYDYATLSSRTRLEFYGLEQMNRSYTGSFVFSEVFNQCVFEDPFTVSSPFEFPVTVLDYSVASGAGCSAPLPGTPASYSVTGQLSVGLSNWTLRFNTGAEPISLLAFSGGHSVPTCGSNDCGNPSLSQKNLNLWNPVSYSGFECSVGSALIQTAGCVNYSSSPTVPLTGWRYTVSDLPSLFDVRVGATTTVYRVNGLDAFNGTYDFALTDEDACSGTAYSEDLTTTADEFSISTSAPCLETSVPGGANTPTTATLTLPPTGSGKVVLTIDVDGVGTFEVDVKDDWQDWTCDTQSDELNESDVCLGNPSPYLTLESEPLFS